MGLKKQFADGSIAELVNAFEQRVDRAMYFVACYEGELWAKYARDNHTYTDRTGNLTNSIGYAVARKNELVMSSIPGNGVSKDNALQVVHKIVETCKARYTVIIVAGMSYAAAVESRGYNVILPAELKMRADFPKMKQLIEEKVKEKAQELLGFSI